MSCSCTGPCFIRRSIRTAKASSMRRCGTRGGDKLGKNHQPPATSSVSQLTGEVAKMVAQVPELFAILTRVCGRAGLARVPELYCLPAPSDMNAYALGGPERSAIVLTEGLLRGMTREEIAGILAHEVAHIRNNDTWTMSWAAALHRAKEVRLIYGSNAGFTGEVVPRLSGRQHSQGSRAGNSSPRSPGGHRL